MNSLTQPQKDNNPDRKLFDFLDKHLIETKKKTYHTQVLVFQKYLEENNLHFDFEGFRKYYYYLDNLCERSEINPLTFNVKVSSIKYAIHQLYENSPFKEDIGKRFSLEESLKQFKLKTISLKYVDPSSYPDKEMVFKILDYCKDKTIKLVIETIFYSGLRISELTNIRMKNIQVGKGWSRIQVLGKGNKYSDVPVETQILKKVIKYFHPEGDYTASSFLFEHRVKGDRISYDQTSLSNRMFKETGYRAHSYRHACLGTAYKETKDIKATQSLGRHSSVSTTLNEYVRSSFTDKELSRIFKRNKW